MNYGIIETIQQECADFASGDPFFANIPIFTERTNDIASEFERALGPVTVEGGKSGACITILTPTADCAFKDIGGPVFDEIPLIWLIQENRQINEDPATGTNQSALSICEKLCTLFSLSFFPVAGNSPVSVLKPTIQRGPTEDAGLVQYNVRMKCMAGLSVAVAQVATPTISVTTGTYTLACSTPGAAMFYTLNGSQPGPRNGTLYTAPFTPATGHTLKVKAGLWGMLCSQTATTNT